MPHRPVFRVSRVGVRSVVVASLLALMASCAPEPGDPPPLFAIKGPDAERARLNRTPWDVAPPKGTARAMPEFSDGYWPCTDCHDPEMMEPNPEKRELEDEHTNIVLAHGIKDRWCLECHAKDDRDKLKLADGRLIPFEKAYRLCAQCHGEIVYEWSLGVHGKRVGNWQGDDKEYYLCANCHRAHDPRIEPIEPKPAPMRPAKIGH